MFFINATKANEFKQLYEKKHLLHIATQNVLFQTIRMLSGMNKVLERDFYKDTLDQYLSDIECVTDPIDSFPPFDIPEGMSSEEIDKCPIFTINRETPEYEEIKNRFSFDFLSEVMGITNDIIVRAKDKPEMVDDILDDCFIYFSIFRYIAKIEAIRMVTMSDFQTVIEYVLENITLDNIKNYIHTKRVNLDKYVEKCSNMLFNPDVSMIEKFYNKDYYERFAYHAYSIFEEDWNKDNPDNDDPDAPTQAFDQLSDEECDKYFQQAISEYQKKGGPKKFSPVELMQVLATNVDVAADNYIILAIYLVMSFAVSDFERGVYDSKCAKYVTEVIANIL